MGPSDQNVFEIVYIYYHTDSPSRSTTSSSYVQQTSRSSNTSVQPQSKRLVYISLETSGLLSEELTDVLDNAIRTSFQAQATTKPTGPKFETKSQSLLWLPIGCVDETATL